MESATAAVRSTSHARARSALVYGGARGARRVVGAVPAAARARRRAPVVVAVASHHQEHLEPLPSRAQEGGAVAVATTQVSRVGPESCARVLLVCSPHRDALMFWGLFLCRLTRRRSMRTTLRRRLLKPRLPNWVSRRRWCETSKSV